MWTGSSTSLTAVPGASPFTPPLSTAPEPREQRRENPGTLPGEIAQAKPCLLKQTLPRRVGRTATAARPSPLVHPPHVTWICATTSTTVSTRMHAPASNVAESAIDGKIWTTTSPRAASLSPRVSPDHLAQEVQDRRPPLQWHHQPPGLPAAVLVGCGSCRGRRGHDGQLVPVVLEGRRPVMAPQPPQLLHPILAGIKGGVPGGFPGRVPVPRSSQRPARLQAASG